MKGLKKYYLLIAIALSGCMSDDVTKNDIPEELRQKLKIGSIGINGQYQETRAEFNSDYGDYIYSSIGEGDELAVSYNFVKGGKEAYSANQASVAYVTQSPTTHICTATFSPSIVLPTGGYDWSNLKISLRYSDKYFCNDALFASNDLDTTKAGGINVDENVLTVRMRHATALLKIDSTAVNISDKIKDGELTAITASVSLGGTTTEYRFVKASSSPIWSAVVPSPLVDESYTGKEAKLEAITVTIGSGETTQYKTFSFGSNAQSLSDNTIYPLSLSITPYEFVARVENSGITPWESSTIAAVSMDEAPGWYYDKESNTYHIYASRGLQNMFNGGVDISHSNVSLDASIDVNELTADINRSPLKTIGKGCVFNGKNNIISGLSIWANEATDVTYIGLVGTNYGIVKNIRVELSSIRLGYGFGGDASEGRLQLPENERETAGALFVGGLVGRNFGLIDNCSVSNMSISVSKCDFTAGLVGLNIKTDSIVNGGMIVNSYTSALNLNGVGNGAMSGFVGSNRDGGEIYSCYCEGNISCGYGVTEGSGFCNENTGVIMGCCYYGTISKTDVASLGAFVNNIRSSESELYFCYSSDSSSPFLAANGWQNGYIYYCGSPCMQNTSVECNAGNQIYYSTPENLYNVITSSYRKQHGSDYWSDTEFFDDEHHYPKPTIYEY